MIFWITAALLTGLALLTLHFAARGGAVNAASGQSDQAVRAHFRAQLAEIETEQAEGRLAAEEAEAAKAELAREIVRQEAESANRKAPLVLGGLKLVPYLAMLAVAVVTFAIYTQIGRPDLPTLPLAGREMPKEPEIDVTDAVSRVEAALAENPDDVRGWSVLAPVYMRTGRFDDAVRAYRRVLDLTPPTADTETDLAEALVMANGGEASPEALALLESAAARDPLHIRSRFYLAGQAMQTGAYQEAVERWQAILSLGTGQEPWVEAVRQGLAEAEAGLAGNPLPPPSNDVSTDNEQDQMIRGMVEGLSERLGSEGGTLEEWTRLVRSWLVLGERDKAQAALAAARAAYPDAVAGSELQTIAEEAGLE